MIWNIARGFNAVVEVSRMFDHLQRLPLSFLVGFGQLLVCLRVNLAARVNLPVLPSIPRDMIAKPNPPSPGFGAARNKQSFFS
jgi:hypothetical protein